MRIRLTQLFLTPVITLFCMIAFSSTLPDAKTVGQEPVLIAKVTKVFVCHFLPNDKFITQEIPLATAQKLIADHPQEWVMGTCEDVISPSS
jgi:hypothetical protein